MLSLTAIRCVVSCENADVSAEEAPVWSMKAMPPAMTLRKRFVFCFIITSFIQTLTVGTVVTTVLPFYRLADFTAGRGLHPALKIIFLSSAKIVKKQIASEEKCQTFIGQVLMWALAFL